MARGRGIGRVDQGRGRGSVRFSAREDQQLSARGGQQTVTTAADPNIDSTAKEDAVGDIGATTPGVTIDDCGESHCLVYWGELHCATTNVFK
jgi:hypothetical protein